jgi:hypothetical protein
MFLVEVPGQTKRRPPRAVDPTSDSSKGHELVIFAPAIVSTIPATVRSGRLCSSSPESDWSGRRRSRPEAGVFVFDVPPRELERRSTTRSSCWRRIAALTELVEAQARCDWRECDPWAQQPVREPVSSWNATRP